MPCDYSKYPGNWKTEIRPRILERASHCCEWCHAENYQPHPITGSKVVLTIAHLNHDITDNRDANLAALCQKCHNGYDAKHRAANRKEKKDHGTRWNSWADRVGAKRGSGKDLQSI